MNTQSTGGNVRNNLELDIPRTCEASIYILYTLRFANVNGIHNFIRSCFIMFWVWCVLCGTGDFGPDVWLLEA